MHQEIKDNNVMSSECNNASDIVEYEIASFGRTKNSPSCIHATLTLGQSPHLLHDFYKLTTVCSAFQNSTSANHIHTAQTSHLNISNKWLPRGLHLAQLHSLSKSCVLLN